MGNSAFFWFILTFVCIAFEGFYSMLEMACVSFNKVHLQYYVSKGNKRALWLNHLLQNPSRLFGTTLLGVNLALQIGSECSRQFYNAIGLSPDLAPITQVLLVLIFAELAPIFAARRYSEHVVMLGIPIVYLSSKIMAPVIFGIDILVKLLNKFSGSKENATSILTREELQKAVEAPDDKGQITHKSDEFNTIVTNIFSLRDKDVQQVMVPLNTVQMLPSNCSVSHMRKVLNRGYYRYLPIYHHNRHNVIGIAYPRELINTPDNHSLRNYIRPSWFITKHANIYTILQEFRTHKHNIAIVLNKNGHAIGIITLQDILDEIFGEMEASQSPLPIASPSRILERTFPSNTKIDTFNKEFDAHIETNDEETLAQLMKKNLGHNPEKGEYIRIDRFEFTVKKVSIFGVHTISAKTLL